MNTIFVMIGISGSGKSTTARTFMNGNQVIVSRDNLRNSLFGYTDETVHEYYNRPDFKTCEDRVTKFFNDQVRYALNNGMDVIADNTHLQASYINAYKQFGAEIKLIFRDSTIDAAVYLIKNRTRQVDEEVIRKQYAQYIKLIKSDIKEQIEEYNKELRHIYATCKKAPHNPKKLDCVVFDIDGTLAHTNGKRSPYDYSNVGVDDADEAISVVCNNIAWGGPNVVICSGREDVCKGDTIGWLIANRISWSDIYMRKAGDGRKDNIIKAELWRKIQKKYNIIAMFDDRNRVVDMARNLGYKVCQVENGDF